MTVSSSVSSIFYYGNTNDPQIFTVPFYFLENSHLKVTELLSDGITTTDLAETTDYTVTGAEDPNGGSITMVYTTGNDHRIGVGEKITIERDLPVTQPVDFITGGQFRAETHEKAIDRIVMILQQILRGGVNFTGMPHNLLSDLDLLSAGHTYKINDANAILKNLYDKLNERREISVMDFGAVGDGINDDTSGFKFAIAFIKAFIQVKGGAGTLIIPPGIYIISDTIVVDFSGLRIKGGGTNNNGDYAYPLSIRETGYGDFLPIVTSNTLIIWNGVVGGTMMQIGGPTAANPSGSPDSFYRLYDLTDIILDGFELRGWDFRGEILPADGSPLIPVNPIAGICLDIIALRSCKLSNITASYASAECFLFRAASPKWVSDGSGGWTWDRHNSARGFSHSRVFSIRAFNRCAHFDITSKANYPLGRGMLWTREGTGGSNCHNNTYLELFSNTFFYPPFEIAGADNEYYEHLYSYTWNSYELVLHGVADADGQAQGFNNYGCTALEFRCYSGGAVLLCGTDTDNPSYPGTSYVKGCVTIIFSQYDVHNSTPPVQAGAGSSWAMVETGSNNDATLAPGRTGAFYHNIMLASRLHAHGSGIGGREQIVGFSLSSGMSVSTDNNWGSASARPVLYPVIHCTTAGFFIDDAGLTQGKIIEIAGAVDSANDGSYEVSTPDYRHSGIFFQLNGSFTQDEVITDFKVHPQMDWGGWNHGIMLLDSAGWMNPVKFIDSSDGCQAGTFIIKQNATGDGIWPGWDTTTFAKIVWLNGVPPSGLDTMPANYGVIISVTYSENIGKYICQPSTIIDLS